MGSAFSAVITIPKREIDRIGLRGDVQRISFLAVLARSGKAGKRAPAVTED